MAAYYNENDKFAAAWLRELIKAGLIADGEVDERSIELVSADDVRGFTQCHFFAGIGGWSYALRLAGWPDDRAVWTGSCPCQPFSEAGRAASADDPRHLWPTWFRLIGKRAPTSVFGEQVASLDGLAWLDLVYADLEGANYAVAALDLCAAGVGAPHQRNRIYFVGERARPHTDDGTIWEGRRESVQVGRFRRTSDDGEIPNTPRTVWGAQPRPPVLADGVPFRVEQVCGYGNAIVPQVAQVFIEAYMSVNS